MSNTYKLQLRHGTKDKNFNKREEVIAYVENKMEFEKLKKIIAEVLNIDESTIELSSSFVDDLGADSLDLFEIITGIEEEFELEIPQEIAENIHTVQDAVEEIKKATDSFR